MIRKTIAGGGIALLSGIGLFAASPAASAQPVPAFAPADPAASIVDESGAVAPAAEWFAPRRPLETDKSVTERDAVLGTQASAAREAGDELDLDGDTARNSDSTKDDDEVTRTLTIEATADKTEVEEGKKVTFTITVKNVHDSMTIKDVVVRSPDLEQCDRDHGDMASGEKITHTCSHTMTHDDVGQTFRPRFRVRGFDSSGSLVSRHSNDTTVTVVAHSNTTPPSPSPSKNTPTPRGPGDSEGPSLPVTGLSSVGTALIAGAVLLVGGAGLWFVGYRLRARRR